MEFNCYFEVVAAFTCICKRKSGLLLFNFLLSMNLLLYFDFILCIFHMLRSAQLKLHAALAFLHCYHMPSPIIVNCIDCMPIAVVVHLCILNKVLMICGLTGLLD